jgi:hypothetical protein
MHFGNGQVENKTSHIGGLYSIEEETAFTKHLPMFM